MQGTARSHGNLDSWPRLAASITENDSRARSTPDTPSCHSCQPGLEPGTQWSLYTVCSMKNEGTAARCKKQLKGTSTVPPTLVQITKGKKSAPSALFPQRGFLGFRVSMGRFLAHIQLSTNKPSWKSLVSPNLCSFDLRMGFSFW